MPPEKSDLKYLWDMLDAAQTVGELVRGKSFEDYVSTKALRPAVERAIEIIGEAARRVSDATREQHPDIPWSAIVATRHIIAHEYGDLQHDKV